MSTQPEALQMAEYLEIGSYAPVALELRRLTQVNTALLDSLRDIVEGTRLDNAGNRNDDGLIDHEGIRNFKLRVKEAQLAIAKAKGEES